MNNFEIWAAGMQRFAALRKASADRGHYRGRPMEEVEDALRLDADLLAQMLVLLTAAVEMPDQFRRLVERLPETPKPNLRLVTNDAETDAA